MSCPIKHLTCHRETEAKCPTKNGLGVPICTLGVTSIPVEQGKAFVEYGIKVKDARITLTLSFTHRQYLKYLLNYGRETTYDYGKVKPELKAHIKELVTMGCLQEVPVVGYSNRVVHRLTDTGANIAGKIIESEI